MTLAAPTTPTVPPAEFVAGRVVLDGVDWAFYQQVLDVTRDGTKRVTYHRGRLEIEMPSLRHEQIKALLRRLVETYAEERALPLLECASTTWDRADIDGGLEADESYYTGDRAAELEGQDIDLARDPPPDLAIEIDLSPPHVRKEPLYADLGVAEIWRWRDDELRCLRRGRDGRYERAGSSVAVAGFPLELAADLVRAHAGRISMPAVKAMRDWCRDHQP